MQTKFISIMAGLAFLGMAGTANSVALNIDFGSYSGPPSSSFGAASGQAGTWNWIDTFITGSGVLDIGGGATGVSITITAEDMAGASPLPVGDANDLMEDNFLISGGGTWALSMAGLSDGVYDVYLYEPHNGLVGTGDGTLNGNAFSDINGNFDSGVFTLGSNYHLLSGVTVAGGALNASASNSNFSGLAGMQLVPIPVPAALPLFASGLGFLGIGAARKLKKH